MIEVHVTYNIRPDVDDQAYFEWMKKGIVPALKSHGMIEVRAHRNIEQRDLVLVVTKWETLDHWKDYSSSEKWKSLKETLQKNFAENIRIEVWGASQLIPTSLRPPK